MAARDPHVDQWFQYIDQLRGSVIVFYKDIIEIARKVRTRWGADRATLYSKNMVNSLSDVKAITTASDTPITSIPPEHPYRRF